MPRYLVMTRRSAPSGTPTARDVVTGVAGVQVVSAQNPDLVTIEASDDTAGQLRSRLEGTHHVEAEVRRQLE